MAQLVALLPQFCCGCGVRLQQENPDAPGYFQVPRRLIELADQQGVTAVAQGGADSAGSAVDRSMEAWLDKQQKPTDAGAVTPSKEEEEEAAPDVRCARCYSLTHYGRIKNDAAESVLPAFDLARKVGRKIALQKDRRSMVLCVVDIADFDGSLPRAALVWVAYPLGWGLFGPESGVGPGALPQEPPFKLAVAVNKFDLLPSQATARRVEAWVRTRLRHAGLPPPEAVYMASAANGFGVREMVANLKDRMGFRADLWVVGAQNAGKSSLITAMKRLGGTGGRREPTVAPVPGTTLGLLRVPGMPLGPKQRTFDTPGVPHAHQLTTQLPLAEVAMLLPKRRLKPRTYRAGAGNTVLLGGLVRVDLVEVPGSSMYLTVYASDEVTTHLGKTEGAEERRARHTGGQLVPPLAPERLAELGPLVAHDIAVTGDAWGAHSADVAIAGFGWVAVGVSGRALLRVWAPRGVAVTQRAALIPDFARAFQRPGFASLLPSSGDSGGGGARKAVAGGERKR